MDRGTTRRFSAVRLLAVASVFCGTLAASACERHPEARPVSSPVTSRASHDNVGDPHRAGPKPNPAEAGRASSPPTSSAPAPASAAARCVDETPSTPPPRVEAGPDPRCPPDPGRPALRHGRVVFEGVNAALDVELAETPEQQTRGLMFRTEMANDAGMLFVFDEATVHSFWMRDTCIPLDMLFITADGLIVGIAESVPTMNDASRAVRCPSLYVLEVNAGWARAHGVKAGMTATLELQKGR